MIMVMGLMSRLRDLDSAALAVGMRPPSHVTPQAVAPSKAVAAPRVPAPRIGVGRRIDRWTRDLDRRVLGPPRLRRPSRWWLAAELAIVAAMAAVAAFAPTYDGNVALAAFVIVVGPATLFAQRPRRPRSTAAPDSEPTSALVTPAAETGAIA